MNFIVLCVAWLSPCLTLAARNIPPSPAQHVWDEPGVMDATSTQWLVRTLSEHERLTSEQVIVAVFDDLQGEELVDFTNRVFKEWRIGKKSKNNGVLLAIYWKNRKSRIEVGYGLEPLLTDIKSHQILKSVLAPRLRSDSPGAAISAATWEILTVLESPLLSGEVAQDRPFREKADFGGASAGRTILVLLLGIGVVLVLIYRMVTPEAHYNARGWYRADPFSSSGWQRRTRSRGTNGIFWGGGGFGGRGGSGGGGGFLGGGGLSGGGGASGDW